MKNLLYQDIYNKICRRLLSQRWLNKWNMDKSIIEKHIREQSFTNTLNQLLEEKNFSCIGVLNLVKALIDELSYGNIPNDWLNYIYQYTLNKSFPDAVTTNLNVSLDVSCELYLRTLKIICEFQKSSEDRTWQSKYPMNFLTEQEILKLEDSTEYNKLLKAFKHNYIYELMKLNSEVMHFNTIDHVCGVHFLALYIGRQFKALGIPIDLGRVSGAAAGHDIGKYGCKGAELKRVPYLHYYYTDQWFKKHNIVYIKNVALNHSTWDLELENLSLESLILIYSDFRVKNKESLNKAEMHIFTLKDSFEVILNKLDNVDEAKEKRYKRVYAKLKDFEDYMVNLNIDTEPKSEIPFTLNAANKKTNYSLLHGEDVIHNLKYLAINHNITLMHQLRDEYSLDNILETARSEKNWKNLREYIRIFEESSTYLTQNQKLLTIKFLYENLIHPEDDIRRHCAELIGNLIAIYDEDYRKEIPENVTLAVPSITSLELFNDYISLMLFPSYKIIPEHRSWMGYSLSIMVNSFFSHCRKNQIPTYRNALLSNYKNTNSKNKELQLNLLETAKFIPIYPYDESLDILFNFILHMLDRHGNTLRISALEVTYELIPNLPNNCSFLTHIIEYLNNNRQRSKIFAENLLILKLNKLLGLEDLIEQFSNFCCLDEKNISEVFLNNLKTATDWIKKKNQINLLLQHTINKSHSTALHTTIHFCNLLKVSAVESVRNSAGSAILMLMPYLTYAERNEVAVELLRALEIEGHRFTEYIPKYLGQIILYLQPKELDEIIDDLQMKIKFSNTILKTLILKTIGISISYYPKYASTFNEDVDVVNDRLIKMLGILLNGLGDYNLQVKQAAFSVLGKDIFGANTLSFEEKIIIFKHTAKKILTLITDTNKEGLLFLSASAGLNHIYRFISDYTFFNGAIEIPVPKNIAFFPGTFDPFSLGHKQIARNIRNLGYEVYLAVDEFSWSKKTLPNLLRKNIINMSIADELNIYIYPDNMPTNIANPLDLKVLRDNFKASEVYIVAGSDVIINASSYKLPSEENSIQTFPHIIFERGKSKKSMEAAKCIEGKVIWLTLPSKFSDISSTQIRTYIDENRDISVLIDPLAQKYIYENGFYQREPLEKSSIKDLWLKSEVVENINENVIKEICNTVPSIKDQLTVFLREHSEKASGRFLLLRDELNNDEIIGFSIFHWVRSTMIYSELSDMGLSDYIRKKSFGRITLIDGMFIKNHEKNKALEQILLTETLAFCISHDYEFGIFKSSFKELSSPSIIELLELHGFNKVPNDGENPPIYIVDMGSPIVLNYDLENVIKEPFRSNMKIKQLICQSRKKLQQAFCRLYPGELVLCFDSNMLYQSMIRMICAENGVSTEITNPKKLGQYMCVPYGDILHRYIIPNTVTKALHTEKYFTPDMKSFQIKEFPHYLDLETQVKMIDSFNRPIILVDNLIHKGYRMQALDPLFKKEDIKVQKIIVGILSGHGKDLMEMQNREINYVYFIPKLKMWFNENALYPFLGGDALWRGYYPERNLLPSINLIMPFTYPTFIRGSSTKAIYNLSKVCIENAIDILSLLEQEYHMVHEKNLTLASLGQVLTIPRCPDHGKDIEYDLNLSPSHYLKNDLELLHRLENIIV